MIKLRKREYTGPSPHAVAIRGRNPSKIPPEHLILERRKQDDFIAEAVKMTEDQLAVDLKMHWETTTNKKILNNTIQRKLASKLNQYGFNLEKRRQELRLLLAEEEQEFISKAHSMKETIEDKQNRMREKAASLKAKREAERQAIVQQKLDRQWQNQCEELRSVLSRRHQDQVCIERRYQLNQQAEMERERQAENAMYAELWNRDRLAKAAREEREAQEAIKRNYDMLEVLEEQRKKKTIEIAADKARVTAEAKQLIVDRQELGNELRVQKEHLTREKLNYRNQLKKHIKTTKLSKLRDDQEELALDMKLLQVAEEEQKAEASAFLHLKEQRKIEDANYRAYLVEQKLKEAEREREIERVIQMDVEAQEAKKAKERLRKKDARASYLQEVLTIRRQQMDDRITERKSEKLEIEKERQRINDITKQHALHQKQQLSAVKATNVKYAQNLKQQMSYNNMLKQRNRDLDHMEYENGLRTEQAYESRLREVLDRVDIQRAHPLRMKAIERGDELIFK